MTDLIERVEQRPSAEKSINELRREVQELREIVTQLREDLTAPRAARTSVSKSSALVSRVATHAQRSQLRRNLKDAIQSDDIDRAADLLTKHPTDALALTFDSKFNLLELAVLCGSAKCTQLFYEETELRVLNTSVLPLLLMANHRDAAYSRSVLMSAQLLERCDVFLSSDQMMEFCCLTVRKRGLFLESFVRKYRLLDNLTAGELSRFRKQIKESLESIYGSRPTLQSLLYSYELYGEPYLSERFPKLQPIIDRHGRTEVFSYIAELKLNPKAFLMQLHVRFIIQHFERLPKVTQAV